MRSHGSSCEMASDDPKNLTMLRNFVVDVVDVCLNCTDFSKSVRHGDSGSSEVLLDSSYKTEFSNLRPRLSLCSVLEVSHLTFNLGNRAEYVCLLLVRVSDFHIDDGSLRALIVVELVTANEFTFHRYISVFCIFLVLEAQTLASDGSDADDRSLSSLLFRFLGRSISEEAKATEALAMSKSL